MISSIVSSGVYSESVIRAMKNVPRHFFVSQALRYKAYDDTSLPIGLGQTISRPSIIGIMVQAAGLSGNKRVLEIGTGSGYQSAILGEIAEYVVTIERIKELSDRARRIIFKLGYSNIRILHTDDFSEADGLFDSIIVAAGARNLPEDIFDKLVEGGVLIIPLFNGSTCIIKKFIKMGRDRDNILSEDIGIAPFVPYIKEECA